jgi:hypothetical protein
MAGSAAVVSDQSGVHSHHHGLATCNGSSCLLYDANVLDHRIACKSRLAEVCMHECEGVARERTPNTTLAVYCGCGIRHTWLHKASLQLSRLQNVHNAQGVCCCRLLRAWRPSEAALKCFYNLRERTGCAGRGP